MESTVANTQEVNLDSQQHRKAATIDIVEGCTIATSESSVVYDDVFFSVEEKALRDLLLNAQNFPLSLKVGRKTANLLRLSLKYCDAISHFLSFHYVDLLHRYKDWLSCIAAAALDNLKEAPLWVNDSPYEILITKALAILEHNPYFEAHTFGCTKAMVVNNASDLKW